jgi:hypothetical protein
LSVDGPVVLVVGIVDTEASDAVALSGVPIATSPLDPLGGGDSEATPPSVRWRR